MTESCLTKAEIERLAILSEECGEVVQIVGKIMRFGWSNRFELRANVELLEQEIGDVLGAIHLLVTCKDVGKQAIEDARLIKLAKMAKYFKHQDWPVENLLDE